MARFQPGQSGNPGGKPVGARNKLQADFVRALAEDFEAGGPAAIQRCREEKPDQYVRVIASLMPKELEVKRTLDEMSDDELDAAIAAVRAILTAQSGSAEALGAGAESAASAEQPS